MYVCSFDIVCYLLKNYQRVETLFKQLVLCWLGADHKFNPSSVMQSLNFFQNLIADSDST